MKTVFVGCCLALGAILLTPTPASAGTFVGSCESLGVANCTANDLVISNLAAIPTDINGNGDCQDTSDTVDIELASTMTVQSGEGITGQSRYDIGVYIAYAPDLSSCGRDTIDDTNSTGGVDADEDGDCLDANQQSPVDHTALYLNVPCRDDDTNGQIDDFLVCHSWGNNGSQVGGDFCDINNVIEGTDAKCFCQLFSPGITVPVCGDGIPGNTDGEECDDGNDIDEDACGNDCLLPVCGDGDVEGNEECDPGASPEGNGQCCVPPGEKGECTLIGECGNGILECDELCDDGNLSNSDACLDTCVPAECGDGFVQDKVEQCDDGNKVDDDSCGNDCLVPVCGDGELEGGEKCDDGNLVDGDGCNANCGVEVPTMGEYGLGALALLLIGAGFLAVRKGNLV